MTITKYLQQPNFIKKRGLLLAHGFWGFVVQDWLGLHWLDRDLSGSIPILHTAPHGTRTVCEGHEELASAAEMLGPTSLGVYNMTVHPTFPKNILDDVKNAYSAPHLVFLSSSDRPGDQAFNTQTSGRHLTPKIICKPSHTPGDYNEARCKHAHWEWQLVHVSVKIGLFELSSQVFQVPKHFRVIWSMFLELLPTLLPPSESVSPLACIIPHLASPIPAPWHLCAISPLKHRFLLIGLSKKPLT